MHSFTELMNIGAIFTLNALDEASKKTIDVLDISGSTSPIKTLQMIQLQKVILAVGMFSIFEASLQKGLNCRNGFDDANKILEGDGKLEMKERFGDLCLAINVLKHGRGRSYNTLVKKADVLPFRIKQPGEELFFEGDVSEISTLVEVNDTFVQLCGDVICDVSEVVCRVRPEFTY